MMLMAICALLWSLGGIFIKLISWHPLLIAGGRSLLAAAVLGGYMAVKKIPIKVSAYSVGAGISLCACFLLFVAANKLTTAANAIVLQYTAPIFILIVSAVFFRDPLKKREILAVLGTVAGMVLFFFDQLSPGNIYGNVMAILAGAFLGVMFTLVGKAGGDDSVRMSGILFSHLLTALIGIPAGLPGTASCTGTEIWCILVLGVVQLGIPYVLYALASRDCPPLACSLIGMLEPLLNPVWVLIFAGEVPGVFALAGACVIIGVVTWWCVADGKTQKENA
jgi:drug/metabolite transporter (DMT)-like permease